MHSFGIRWNQSGTPLFVVRTACHLFVQVKRWVEEWKVSIEQRQELYRNMHEAYAASGDSYVTCIEIEPREPLAILLLLSASALQLLLELLGTYTKETASKARTDALK
jgi:hypothetical protein